MPKLAVKRLTKSDLTFLEVGLRRFGATVKQKGLNLNADVLIDQFFPSLTADANGIDVRIHVHGPGLSGGFSLRRRIRKSSRAKNWRINGVIIKAPVTEPNRFDVLDVGDYAVLVFSDTAPPDTVSLIFVAKAHPDDATLHAALCSLPLNGSRSMKALDQSELMALVSSASPRPSHPVHLLTSPPALTDADVEDIALGGNRGAQSLLRRPNPRRMTAEQLRFARDRALEIGNQGEEFVDAYLATQVATGALKNYEWVSASNAISPHDFALIQNDGSRILLDVKATPNDFGTGLHISLGQLQEMADPSSRYALFRVYRMTESIAELQIAEDVGAIAADILRTFSSLRSGVSVDAVTVEPTVFSFGPPITVTLA